MADLIAQGQEVQQRWRRPVPEGEPVVLGRTSGAWAAPWDHHISRRHAVVVLVGGHLEVKQLPEARNPVFFRGQEVAEFRVAPGEHFVIGETTFTLADQRVAITVDAPRPIQQQTFSAKYLKQVQFHNPDHRMEVLSRLPQAISGATDDNELCVRLVSMLLAGAPRAETAAVVAVEGRGAGGEGREEGGEGREEQARVSILHWDQRRVTGGGFGPSQRLILEAIGQRQSVLHLWEGAEAGGGQNYTATGNVDWAFCTPVLGRGCEGWALYLAGRFGAEIPNMPSPTDPTDVREDMKFTELVAATLSSFRQMRILQHQHANLSQFFSPLVLENLRGEDPELALAPRETDVSVLFCDLRGFSREAERQADDLMGLLRRVSQALGVMTHHILEQGGVVGDFQGDAAMGFWGWPLAREDDTLRTARAALGIRAEFEAAAQDAESFLAGFHAGIGIATGPAVAGKIGTIDQVKVTVFGPVVNLASRLEGMTKSLRAPILLDETTARAIRQKVPSETARVRRLAVVKPYGLDTPLEVSELLPPESAFPLVSNVHLEQYEEALDAFLAGRWREAFQLLHRIPTEDQVTDFLTVYIAQHNRVPPTGWDGVIPLGNK